MKVKPYPGQGFERVFSLFIKKSNFIFRNCRLNMHYYSDQKRKDVKRIIFAPKKKKPRKKF
jgi:hypothetical protein